MLSVDRVLADYDALSDEVIRLRRDFHQHPELGFQEHRTAGIVATRLRELDLEVRSGVAETGVVGTIRGGLPGPGLVIRADFDALPVQEENDLPFRSLTPGRMHACGHDGHTAVALGVAEVLARHRERLRGVVKFAFQPAEEIIAGAKPMLEQGVLEDPPVETSLVFHLTTELPTGQVSVRSGPIMASADRFELTVRGTGGHGAYPHRSVDAITVASEIVVALQTLVSREVPPTQPAVISIGQFQAGTAFNILPPEAHLSGTLRALDRGVRERLAGRIGDLARGVATAMRAEAVLDFQWGCPPVVNDVAMTERVRRASRLEVGPDGTIEDDVHMGADDAAWFLEARPGCYFFVGAANAAKAPVGPHHSPQFGVDEQSLAIAGRVMLRAILEHQHG